MAAANAASGSAPGNSMMVNVDILGGISYDNAKGNFLGLPVSAGALDNETKKKTLLSSSFGDDAGTIIQALNHVKAQATSGASSGTNDEVQVSNNSGGFTSDTAFRYASNVLHVDADITAAGAAVVSAAAGNISLTSAAAKVIVDAETDIDLDAKGSDINFLNDGTSRGSLDLTNAGDLGFKDSDGTEIFRIDGSANSLLMASTNKIEFTDAGEYIHSDAANDLMVNASTNLNLAIAGTDVATVTSTGIASTGIVSGVTSTFSGTGSFSHVAASKDIVAQESVSGANILGTTFAGTTATFTGTGSFSHVAASKDISAVESVSGANILGTTFAGTTATFSGTGSFSHVIATKDIVATESVSGANILGTTFAGTTATFSGTGSFSHVAASKDITATESVIGARLTDGAFSVTGGGVTGVTTLAASGLITAGSFNDGAATYDAGTITSAVAATFSGQVQAATLVGTTNVYVSGTAPASANQWGNLPKFIIQGTDAAGAYESFHLAVSGGLLRVIEVGDTP